MARSLAWIKRIITGLLIAVLVIFAGDYVSVRFRIPQNRPQFGTVDRSSYYAVKMKNGKTEFMFDPSADPVTLTCSHSLFPQLGSPPCWYLQRQKQQQIKVP